MEEKKQITIGWLYPDLMSTYGDRGNIQVLKMRSKWNGIDASVLSVDQKTTLEDMEKIDFIFGGGSQDIQQEIVMRDLMGKKGEKLKELIENDVPALFVCGAPQIMGRYYEPAMGRRINGVGVFDMYTINPGPDTPRCIGNIVAETSVTGRTITIVGFENHGGRTHLGAGVRPFAKVIHGFGNNGEDKTEGVIYKNAIGCYFHGPLLPKNPEIAECMLQKAVEVKYKTKVEFKKDEGLLEKNAREAVILRY
jgi:lipid II isoglutaminyl synthase (glutamine-hydrolysing)